MKADLEGTPIATDSDDPPEVVVPYSTTPISRDEQDAKLLATLARVDPVLAARETTRLNAQKLVEATLLPGDRLETYDEAWVRLGLPGTPRVDAVKANGVVLQRVLAVVVPVTPVEELK